MTKRNMISQRKKKTTRDLDRVSQEIIDDAARLLSFNLFPARSNLLILDIDGTLISQSEFDSQVSSFKFRPGLLGFLAAARSLGFKLAIWSAANEGHVENTVTRLKNSLDEPLHFLFTWDNLKCTTVCRSGKCHILKPLMKVWERFPEFHEHNTVILDNTPSTYQKNKHNAIPIPTFFDNIKSAEDDIELKKIIQILADLSWRGSVPSFLINFHSKINLEDSLY